MRIRTKKNSTQINGEMMNEKKDKKVSFKPTLMDQALMEKIGWSEEDVQSFVEDIDEEEKVGTMKEEQKVATMKEEQKVATMKEGISGAPGFFCQAWQSRLLFRTKSHPNRKRE